MPRGGSRTNAGRRPKSKAAPDIAVQSDALPIPGNLSAEEARYWAQWAPLATRLRTLTDETQPGFTLLCRTACEADRLWGLMETNGGLLRVDGSAHPLLPAYRGLRLRHEQLLARFNLVPSGRPVERPSDDPPDEIDEWGRPKEDFYGAPLNRPRA